MYIKKQETQEALNFQGSLIENCVPAKSYLLLRESGLLSASIRINVARTAIRYR